MSDGGIQRDLPAPHTVHLGLGSNMGDRQAHLNGGLQALQRIGQVTAVSGLYETPPFGVTDQPSFYNAACALETGLSLPSLLQAVKAIEWDQGRRPGRVWGPRPLDIDLELDGVTVLDTSELTVPHKGLAERAFVLVPLADIAGDAVHPVLHASVRELLGRLPTEDRLTVTLVAGPGWFTP